VREVVRGHRSTDLTGELAGARSVLRAAGVACTVHGEDAGAMLPPEAQTALGWVAREAVTNVLRHSRATVCTITLRTSGGEAELQVVNDGVLEEVATTDDGRPGSGLTGLGERLTGAGGSLETRLAGVVASVVSEATGEPEYNPCRGGTEIPDPSRRATSAPNPVIVRGLVRRPDQAREESACARAGAGVGPLRAGADRFGARSRRVPAIDAIEARLSKHRPPGRLRSRGERSPAGHVAGLDTMPRDLPQLDVAPLRHPAQHSERLVGGDLQAASSGCLLPGR
jgi:hypothetical protein